MKERISALRSACIAGAYQGAYKKLLFRRDPEDVHDRFVALGERLGRHGPCRAAVRLAFSYQHPSLRQDLLGLRFANPIGLAAGFDKDARLTAILPDVGFGFMEAGSITGEPCQGNPRPRLWRLPRSRSLAVYYGLKNDGCQAIAERLDRSRFRFPVGMSIAKTNDQGTVGREAGIADYAKAFRAMAPLADYLTVNISCPNAFGGQPFTDAESLDLLLGALDTRSKPVFVKLSPDLSEQQLDDVLATGARHGIAGYIASNLTKRKHDPRIRDRIKDPVPDQGGLSGKVSEPLARNMVRDVYARTRANGDNAIVIGCGGIFTARDAYAMIRSGASLLQLITGMIYQGPQAIGQINQGLARLLRRDGFESVSQAVGADARKKGKAT